jgi:hypothetical protein
MPLLTIYSYIIAVSFIDGGNWNTHRPAASRVGKKAGNILIFPILIFPRTGSTNMSICYALLRN